MSTNRNACHKRPTRNHTRQGVALAVTTVVSAGAVVAGAGVAGAAETPVSQSRGFFLSGSALGQNLDNIVKVDDARAVNTGNPATVTHLNPLGATLLNSLRVPLGPVNLLGNNGLLTLGAVNQAAIARSNGSAIGASGAVADSGAIAVGGRNGVPAANATLDLGNVLGSSLGAGLVGGLVDADLSVGAISANATQTKCPSGKQVGDYRIADLVLDLRSPLLAGVLSTLTTQLTALQPTASGLESQILALPGLAAAADPLNTGGLITVNVTNVPNLTTLLNSVDTTLGDGAVSVDLTNGTIHVDIEALLQSLGLDLNNLPPNTEIIDLIIDALNSRVLDLVTAELDKLAASITQAVQDMNVVVSVAGLPVSNAALTTLLADFRAGLVTSLLAPVTGSQNNLVGPGSDLLDPAFGALADLLSIRVNVQNRSGGMFTERAMQIRVLPASNVATVNLASASVGPGQCAVANEETTDRGNQLPDTGAADSAPLAAAGLALMLAGAAATAGAGRMGNSSGGAHAGARGRGSSGGGRHARR